MDTIDIIIPTLKTKADVQTLVDELTQTAGVPVRVYPTCQPVSASKNRNIGLDWAESEYVVMVDDDTEHYPHGWAVKLASVMDQHHNCVMVSPQLAKPDGSAGCMMGGCLIAREGATCARERKLPTACVMVRKNQLRFDEAFMGSGWEDDDYCAQLRAAFPDAQFMVCHDVWVVHRNEMKNQRGVHWDKNKALYCSKWNTKDNKHQ